MFEIIADVSPHAEPKVVKMNSGHIMFSVTAEGMSLTLLLDEHVAERLHAELATSLQVPCKPRTLAEIDGMTA